MQTGTRVSSSGPGFQTGPKKLSSAIITRVLSCLLMAVICFNMVVPAHAYSSVHIQCSIDLATWEILTAVVTDEVGITATSPEWRRMQESDLETLKNSSNDFSSALSLIDEAKVGSRDKELANSGHPLGVGGIIQNAGIGVEKNRVLTFPTDQNKRDSSNSTDAENALRVNNEISFDLNQAFSVYCERNGVVKTPDAVEMLSKIKSFMSEAGGSAGGSDYITYYASANGTDTTQYRWRTNKYTGSSSESVTWTMLIVEAFNNFSLAGEEAVDSDNVYSGNPNQLTKALVAVFRGLLDGLRSILGLWSMDELLFCDGWRAAGYVGGIFPRTWEPVMWGLFIFMEIMAAMILGFGIISNVLRQAAASVNTIARMRMMSQIQDLFVCGIALALLPIALRMVIALSGNLVDMVSAMRPLNVSTGEVKSIGDMVKRFSRSSGSLGGVIAEFLYFGIQIYFNFFYALRSLVVFALVILAPMMIALITISPAKKQTTMNWLKELLANILIQPVQTFCITAILLLPTNPHQFDNMIALYAMIPLTSMVRGLFFGASGSWVDQAAQKGKDTTSRMALGAAGGAVRAGLGGIGNVWAGMHGSEENGSSENNSAKESNESAGDNTNLTNSKSNSAGQTETASSDGSGGANANPAGNTSNAETGTGDSSSVNGGSGDARNSGSNPGGTGDGAGGGASPDSAASPLADAQNAQPSSQVNPSAGTDPSDPDKAKEKTPFSQTKTGKVLGTTAKLGGGIALGALGGAISGAGFGDIGRSIQNTGSSIISGIGQKKQKEDNQNNNQQNENPNQTSESEQTADGDNQNLSRPQTAPQEPVTLGDVGKRKANDSSGAKEMQVRDLNQAELDKQGIGDIDDSKRSMEFTAKGNSQQARELGAYADYLNTLSPNARRREVNSRGIEATRTDDGVQVRIDKDKWSRANGGAEISARTNPRTKESTMRIKSPEGGKVPSFTGSAKAVSVNAVQVPKAVQESVSRTKDGTAIQKPEGMQQDLMNKGMSEKAASRTAERAGLIRDLQSQGYSPSEAAKMSKKMMSGVNRTNEVSIPKAELSPEQQMTMIQAQQAGTVTDDGAQFYKASSRADQGIPVFDADPQQESSFTSMMETQKSVMDTVNQAQSASSAQPDAAQTANPSPAANQPHPAEPARPAAPDHPAEPEADPAEQPVPVSKPHNNFSGSNTAENIEHTENPASVSAERPPVSRSSPQSANSRQNNIERTAPVSGSNDTTESKDVSSSGFEGGPSKSPVVETPAQVSQASETNGVSSVQSQPTSAINPELAKRFEAYKKSDAYKAAHPDAAKPSGQPAEQPAEERGGAEGQNLETGRNGSSYIPPNPVKGPDEKPRQSGSRKREQPSQRDGGRRQPGPEEQKRRRVSGERPGDQTDTRKRSRQEPRQKSQQESGRNQAKGLEPDAGDILNDISI